MSRTIESPLSLQEAQDRILAQAEPVEAIETSLGEALGLVLAEPVVADVDHPPFDRAKVDGYAVRAVEASAGVLLRVVRLGRSGRLGDPAIEAGEAGRVLAGDPMPPGSDSVARPSSVRPDPETGPTRVIEILQETEPHRDVTHRRSYLSAGTTLVAAGTRIKPAMVPLLASQGCVSPVCHRRVGVSILNVGHQWVSPSEAPRMNHERNATNLALVALSIRAEAIPLDYQAVAASKLRPALERATLAPVVILLGPPSRHLARALAEVGFESLVDRVAVDAVGRARFGLIRDDEGKVVNHIFLLPSHPVAASVGFTLLVQPLIARLQGETFESKSNPSTIPLAKGEAQPATERRTRVLPANLRVNPDGQRVAETIRADQDDLPAWSRADGLVVFRPRSGPWQGGDLVEFVPIGTHL